MTQGLADDIKQTFLLALEKQNAGHLNEAEPLYHVVLNRKPDYAEAHHNLGLILMDRGQYGAAVAYFRHAIRLQPKLAESHNSLGNAYLKAGLAEEAEASFRRAIAAAPAYAKSHFNLANLLNERGQLAEAERFYREAIRIDPNFRDAFNNLANLLRQTDRREESLAALGRALEIDPDYALAHNNRGNVLRDLDRLEEAVASYLEAIRLAPDFALAHFNLGNALRDLGRMDEAAACYRKTIELDPANADAYRHLVQATRLKKDDPLVQTMMARIKDPSVGDGDRIHLAFALGSVFDKNRDYDRAFSYFRLANALKRKSFSYDPRGNVLLFDRIRQRLSAAAIRDRTPAANNDESPIFIVGMMRSGTTLMEQILASHPDVTGGDELPFLQRLVDRQAAKTKTPYPAFFDKMGEADFAEMGNDYIRMVREKFGHSCRFVTDKMPQNLLYLGLVHLMLPRAKFIYMSRDPLDTCLSVYTLLFTQHHPYAYDLREAGQYYKLCRELMDHWNGIFGDKILYQPYEELVEKAEESVRRVLAFCDLPFHEDCLNFFQTDRPVKTASAAQVRQQLHKGSMKRWKNYERHLSELKAMFAEKEHLSVA